MGSATAVSRPHNGGFAPFNPPQGAATRRWSPWHKLLGPKPKHWCGPLRDGSCECKEVSRVRTCNNFFVEPLCSGGGPLISVSESHAGSILASGSFWTFLDFERFCNDGNHKSLLTSKQQQARQVLRHTYSVDPSPSPCHSLIIPAASESKSTLIYELGSCTK